jgi:transposase
VKKNEPKTIELTEEELQKLKSDVFSSNLSDEQKKLINDALSGMSWMSKLLKRNKLNIKKIKKLFGFQSEKKDKLDSKKDSDEDNKDDDNSSSPKSRSGSSSNRNGKNGKDKFTGAKKVVCDHESLSSGDRCPACGRGNLYNIDAGSFITIRGHAPLEATRYELEKLRCSGCGKIFTADLPDGVEKSKYDATSDAMIAMSRYELGVPMYRSAKLQGRLGVPVPESTQWERIEHLAAPCFGIFNKLCEIAANGHTAFIDDTGVKILEFEPPDGKRSGLFTTGIVSKLKDKVIRLFFTGNRHAGENINNLLKLRKNDDPIIQMSDALASNMNHEANVIICNCLTHCRRNFVVIYEEEPQKIEYLIKELAKIYYADKQTSSMTAECRLKYLQKKCLRMMMKLRRWCLKMFYNNKVEPNSNMGGAIQYLLRHWNQLTQFLRIKGAPICNNIVERLLKTAIVHRKNSLFYKTENGALIGDIMMSLIQTCVSAKKNPFEYLVAIGRNRSKVFKEPDKWLPWNFEVNSSV